MIVLPARLLLLMLLLVLLLESEARPQFFGWGNGDVGYGRVLGDSHTEEFGFRQQPRRPLPLLQLMHSRTMNMRLLLSETTSPASSSSATHAPEEDERATFTVCTYFAL
uniref:Secreted protein n=1 Tax=Steinernema glaseri TaxID=37863 RepID=A0A1I7YIY0_9BILA